MLKLKVSATLLAEPSLGAEKEEIVGSWFMIIGTSSLQISLVPTTAPVEVAVRAEKARRVIVFPALEPVPSRPAGRSPVRGKSLWSVT